ncbi:hypothetical protein O6H91_04G058300 [Diphasiastrum complanatum]|uniref:Uncharacterized protein n=5 Tax=Diphasiastrum complanatum TaxID=34168 RepID=A0ACC2DXV4_DIPCM|nr:hypothetical protein O6H91_04G058300 [Diphasiastrum complanatum]KAJ7558841.1 hypothetical protein O6H91_04G058300 [Diphasiastrum complanatum]KAJ7558842.1 hypothetical protein O6H91_04G058300 [Diphasiastrum complanatum]KAJ7558843.1 hypothetical protein O6H91_04G058300 [Diphasiastrum complanatum]
MKSSKDSKGDGSKQPKGGGCLETGALFPRLHVKETKNAGPRAPPRNKMALYEQLTVPAHTFVPSPAKPASATQMMNTLSYTQCPYNGGLVAPMYMTPPIPFPAMGVGYDVQGEPSMATDTSNEAEVERVPGVSRPAGNSMISSEAVPCWTTSVNVRDTDVLSLARRAVDDFTVPTFSADKMSRSALTDCHLAKENLPQHQLSGQNVDGRNGASLTRDCSKSGDSEIPQLQSQPGVDNDFSLKLSKASKKSSQEDRIEAGSNEIGPKECGSISKVIVLQSSKDQSCSSQPPQWHDFDRSGSSCEYHLGKVGLESLGSHRVSGNEGSASGDILEVTRQNYVESSNKASGVLRGPEDVFNIDQRHGVNAFGENLREVASLLVRQAQNFQPSLSNNSGGTGDVENQTDGSGVEVSEPSQPEGGEASDDSESSMVDSLSLAKVSPKDVIGAVGQHEFWRMRKAILKQQRLFAMQLFELHRLVKVQEIMADSPALQIEEIAECPPPAGALQQKDLESLGIPETLGTPEINAVKDDEKEAKEVNKQKEDGSMAPAITQVSYPPEPAHHTSPFIDNAQNIHSEQQARMYAAPYSYPIIPGQANAWGYTPYPNVGMNHWVGAMAAGSAAYGYQPYGPFPPFHPSLGAYHAPYGPMFGVPSPFELRPIYPLIGYEQRPKTYSDVYQINGPSPNQNWQLPMPMHASSPAGSAPGSDGITRAPSPYTSPFVDPGPRDRSDVRGYVDHFASTQAAVARRPGQVGPSGLAGEPSSERLDTTSMEAARWNASQFYVRQGEHYAPFLGHQQPMYYAPRGVFPGLPSGHLEYDQGGQSRGQTISEAASSSDRMPSDNPLSVENVEYEQDKLFKRPREGSHTGRMIQHEDKLEKGFTQDGLPVFPWGSSFNAFDHGRPHMPDWQHERVIKVVPRAMVATPESAAEILHSIQQERQG